MMFEPRLLRAFVILAETGNFTLAAEQLHLSQSTVSQQINRLEEMVGQALVDRTQRPIQLTNGGEKLLSYARKILSLQLEAQAQLSHSAGRSSLKIGIPDDIASAEMIATFAQFAKQHQELRLDVTTGLSQDLSQRFRHGEFDIVVVKEPQPANDHYLTLSEPLCWYHASKHADDWDEPLPLITFPPGGLYRDTMFERVNQEGKHWYVAFSSGSLNNVLAATEAGLGLTLLPVGAVIGRDVKPYPSFGNERAMALSMYCAQQSPVLQTLADIMGSQLRRRYDTTQRALDLPIDSREH
ncbi:LysR family transcriptional regulator [Photobacterium sp. MCCC 1A19761]|uniref:LysR family transcriptional regulator n=1 Tax=Photobacterium sp. MCCC 1A19761 TaxID=3115000 RepID=UPI00307D5C4A